MLFYNRFKLQLLVHASFYAADIARENIFFLKIFLTLISVKVTNYMNKKI